jgi:hypothetical protein
MKMRKQVKSQHRTGIGRGKSLVSNICCFMSDRPCTEWCMMQRQRTQDLVQSGAWCSASGRKTWYRVVHDAAPVDARPGTEWCMMQRHWTQAALTNYGTAYPSSWRVMNEYWIGQDLEGNGSGSIKTLPLYFSGWSEENHLRLQSEQLGLSRNWVSPPWHRAWAFFLCFPQPLKVNIETSNEARTSCFHIHCSSLFSIIQ